MRHLTTTLRIFVWFSLRHMRRHPVRALAVLLGVALGSAVFTSVRLSIHASLVSLEESMARVTGAAQWSVVQPGGRVPDTLVAELLRDPLVRSAAPVLSAYVQAQGGAQEPFLLLGVDPIMDRTLRRWQTARTLAPEQPEWAELMARPGALLISPRLALELGLHPDDAVMLRHARDSARFHIAGILRAEGLALADGGRLAIADIATFQEFLDLYGRVDRIDLVLKPGAGSAEVAALRTRLPPGVLLSPADRQAVGSREMVRAYQFNLSLLSFVSLFVGMFLVYSLVALNAAERRPELAVLRALGASPRLLFMLFMGEGAFLGLAGWLVALPVGGLMVSYLLKAVSATISTLFVRLSVEHLYLSAWEIALSFGVTVCIALLAAWQPAHDVMRINPREAMEIQAQPVRSALAPHRLALIGLALIAAVYPVSYLPSPPDMSLPGYLAAFMLFSGFAALAPFSLRYWGNWIAPRLARRGSQPAYLAARYLAQSGRGRAVSVGALITAVALFAALVIMIHSFRGTVSLWVSQSIGGDLYVRPKMAALNQYRDPLTPQTVAALKRLPPPAQLVPSRRFELRYGTLAYTFEAIDYAQYRRWNRFVWMAADPAAVSAAFMAGKGVVISQVFANRTGLRSGDIFRTRIGALIMERPVLGVFRDYRTQGGVVYELLSHYQQQSGDQAWSAVQVNFSTRGPALAAEMTAVKRTLLTCCGDELELTEGVRLRQEILRIFDDTFAVTSVLLLISLIVAALGIAVTMAVLVLQRTRELNTLIAVGAARQQIRRMIWWETVLIVTAGETAGLACGFILSHLLIDVVNLQSFGWTFMYQVDWPMLAMAMPLIFGAALVAVVPAVRLAFRHPPASLLRAR